MGEQYGIISKAGSSYSYGEMKLGRGYDATRQFLKADPKLSNEILKKIKEEMKK